MKTNVLFRVAAMPCPQVTGRIFGFFGQHGLIVDRAQLSSTGAALTIAIEISGLDRDRALSLAAKIETLVMVDSVALELREAQSQLLTSRRSGTGVR